MKHWLGTGQTWYQKEYRTKIDINKDNDYELQYGVIYWKYHKNLLKNWLKLRIIDDNNNSRPERFAKEVALKYFTKLIGQVFSGKFCEISQ